MASSPTYYGHIASVDDALLVVEACLRGVLNPSPRRLVVGKESERLIKSGHVFAYSSSSQIKRWRDGKSWSASRVYRGFIQYRELQQRPPSGAIMTSKPSKGCLKRNTETAGLYVKNGGLIKKTIRIDAGDVNYHVISYHDIQDINDGIFNTPSDDPLFENISPRAALLTQFPWLREEVDPAPDGSDNTRSESRRHIVLPLPKPTSKFGCTSPRQYSLFGNDGGGGSSRYFVANIGSAPRD